MAVFALTQWQQAKAQQLIALSNQIDQQLGESLPSLDYRIWSVTFNPNAVKQPQLISGSEDGTITFWDIASGLPLGQPLKSHSLNVNSVAVSPKRANAAAGRILATGNDDHTVRLWDMDTFQPLGLPLTGHVDNVWDAAFSANGKKLASSSRDGTIIVWDLNLGSWIRRACDIANRNLTEAEWHQYLGDEPYHATCNLNHKITP